MSGKGDQCEDKSAPKPLEEDRRKPKNFSERKNLGEEKKKVLR